MDKFLEKYNLPNLNEQKGESLNRPITAGEIEAVIKKFPKHQSPGSEDFTREFYETFQEELTPIFQTIPKIQEDRRLTNCFREASIIIILKPEKDKTKKEITGQYCR